MARTAPRVEERSKIQNTKDRIVSLSECCVYTHVNIIFQNQIERKMSITSLSTEILQRIYEYATIQDALHLAQTSRRNYRTFLGRRMPILEQTMQNSYGPLSELAKLVISSEPDKSRRPMGTELRRSNMIDRINDVQDPPKLNLDLMKKMMSFGKVAERWTEVYPRMRWRFGSSNRRLLRPHEKERLRRAVYNHWIYTNLFHDQTYTQFDPRSPASNHSRGVDDLRLGYIRSMPSQSLSDLSEFVYHIRMILELDLFPSNDIVQEYYSYGLPRRSLEKLAWGENTSEYQYLIDFIMKLGPCDMLHLVENTHTKAQRADFIDAQGEHFKQARETLSDAIAVRVRLETPTNVDLKVPQHLYPHHPSVALAYENLEGDIPYCGDPAVGIVDVSEADEREFAQELERDLEFLGKRQRLAWLRGMMLEHIFA